MPVGRSEAHKEGTQMDSKPLTERQEKYVRSLTRGASSYESALAAGYSESYSRKSSVRLLKIPAVAQAIEGIRKEGRELAAYDLSRAVLRCEKAVDFAYEKGNPMAVVKGMELLCKLSGLLVEKLEVVSVNLVGALNEAKARAGRVSLPTALGSGAGVGVVLNEDRNGGTS
ncbi:MAG: terminase small subunit [Methylocella sp.]